MQIFNTAISLLALALLAQGAPAPQSGGMKVVDPDDIVVSFDFDDKNIDRWWMNWAGENPDFFMDVQQSRWNNDVVSWALRIGEITTVKDTEVKVGYRPKFQLESGVKYQIAFSARTSLIKDGKVAPGLGSEFGDYLQVVVYNAKENVYNVRPGKGIYYGNEWYRWGFTFIPDQSQAGDSYFGLIISASGYGVDWWFDDIILARV